MGDKRGPVRHRRSPRRAATPTVGVGDQPSPTSSDLQAVFATLARRAKLPTAPEATPGSVLRAAGLPLLMATVVTGAQTLPAEAAVVAPAAPQSARDSWTVTSVGDAPNRATASNRPATSAGAQRATGAPNRPRDSTPAALERSAPPSASARRPAGPHASATNTSPPAADGPRITYTVRPGDTLQRIADFSGRSLPAIIELNGLRPDQAIKPGQVIVLPPPIAAAGGRKPATTPRKPIRAGKTAATPGKPTTTPRKPAGSGKTAASGQRTGTPGRSAGEPSQAPTLYTVRPGDTVIDIARRFRRSWTGIIRLNGLAPNGLIRPGDVLKLPPAAAKAAPVAKKVAAKKALKVPMTKTSTTPATRASTPPATRPYVIVKGDTLIGICADHKVRLQEVLKLNHLQKDSIIYPGQKLLLPAPGVKADSESSFLGRTYPPAVVAAAKANRTVLAHRKLPTHEQVKAMIIATAKQRGLDPALALAVAYQESGFSQRMVSPANAIGVMQVIPSTGKWASDLIGRQLDLLDTQDNVLAGVVILTALSKATENEPQAIAGYYQGLTSVRNKGMFDDTRRYVANVQTLKSRFAKTV